MSPMSESDDLRDFAARLGINLPGSGEVEKTAIRPPAPPRRPPGTGTTPDSGSKPPQLPPDTPAGGWQAKLAGHFASLARARMGVHAVFGLEHGLEGAQLEAIFAFVRSEVRLPPEERHWLLWAIYAAEIGYHYNGEYWQTFARETPGWDDSSGSRHWIRQVFQWFGQEYRGPQPSGAWAKTFSIIAWPITNALLPKDLQRHLARALYEVQSGLKRHLADSEDLGRYIAANSWAGSDRFQQLTDQPLLLGQIALALLRPDEDGAETILRSTLDRVAGDLKQERQAATWLNSARRTVEKSEVRGRGRPFASDPSTSPSERLVAAARASGPQLVLVPDSRVEDEWAVRLRLPFLGPLLDVSPEIRTEIAGSRASIPADPTARLATGQLLYPDQEIELNRWPIPGEPLLRFEGLSRGLETAVLSQWAMTPGPWLFAIRRNGVAAEIKSGRVRPGNSYLLAVFDVSGQAPLASLGLPRPKVRCADILLTRLDVPQHLGSDWVKSLQAEGLAPVQELSVWPAGVLPAEWDGEGRLRWLSSDHPLVGLRADHLVQDVLLTVNQDPVAAVESIHDSEARFVPLTALGSGDHTLSVSYIANGEPVTTTMMIEIRDPRPSREASSGPMVVWVEPFTRKLEDLWEGRSVVRADGMDYANGTCTLSLGSESAVTQLAQKSARGIQFPLRADEWRRLLRDSLQTDEGIRRAYSEAKWARVVLEAGPMGRYALEFERDLPPVRWLLDEQRDAYSLELRDDTEGNANRELCYATFERPDVWSAISGDQEPVRIEAVASGGLYVVRIGERGATIVVPPNLRRLNSFSALGLRPFISPRPRRADALVELAETTRLWASARLAGDVRAQVWRSQIIRLLHADVFSLICGAEWRTCESALEKQRSEGSYRRLERLVVHTPADRLTIAGSLVAQGLEFTSLSMDERIERYAALARRTRERAGPRWRSLAQRHGEAAPLWLAQFCLRAATDAHLDTWAGDSLFDALGTLLEWPLLARTARCLGMASLVAAAEADYPPLFPGWEWSLV